MKKEYENIIKKVNDELKKNKEWIERYKKYISLLNKQKSTKENKRNVPQIGENLGIYNSLSEAVKKEVNFDIRYEGQSVGTLRLEDENLYLEPKIEENRKAYVEYSDNFNKKKLEWGSSEAKDFINYFEKSPKRLDGKSLSESKLESKLLKQFSKKSSVGKLLKYIQPVTLLDVFFQMPTPIKASDAKRDLISYANHYGGGIDILARQGRGGRGGINNNPTVIELKKEYKSPENAIKQAIAYATFIQKLLRTEEAGNIEWWKFFRYTGSVHNPLTIRAVIAMPHEENKNNNKSFINEPLYISYFNEDKKELKDKLELHYIYFNLDKDSGEINNLETSLPNQR